MIVGFGVVSIWVLVAILIPLIPLHNPNRQDLTHLLEGPSLSHPLGRDSFGRDVLSRTLVGARVSLGVGFSAVGLAVLVGVVIGLAAGFYGKGVDSILMRTMDAFLSFPPVLLAIVLVGSFGPSFWNVVIAIAIVTMPVFARLVRSSTLSVQEEEYVSAAKALGASPLRILLHHILPNTLSSVIAQAGVSIAAAMVTEAALSYLGIGVQPPTPSWGMDLREGQRWLRDSLWVLLGPALGISSAVWGVNTVADAVRDLVDPRSGASNV